MRVIEHNNASLKGVLPKDYAQPALDKRCLGEVLDLAGNIAFDDNASRSRDASDGNGQKRVTMRHLASRTG